MLTLLDNSSITLLGTFFPTVLTKIVLKGRKSNEDASLRDEISLSAGSIIEILPVSESHSCAKENICAVFRLQLCLAAEILSSGLRRESS